jgi:uncharacterized RDD family membrane protein YckC
VSAAGYAALELPLDGADSGYAGWGRRFSAWLIDAVLVFAALVGLSALGTPGLGYELVLLGAAVVTPLYYALQQGGARGQTLGKRALGILVCDEHDFGPIGYGRALGRAYFTWVLWGLLYLPAILDGLWPLWDKNRQAWHDKIAGTVVVRTDFFDRVRDAAVLPAG